MSKAVFTASPLSGYADRPGDVYHVPNRYLKRVIQTLGDWVIFYRSRRSRSAMGYHSVQRVEWIVADPAVATHSFAVLDRASELSFERLVPRLKTTGAP